MDLTRLKAHRAHTFSFERVLFVWAFTLAGLLSCTALVVEALVWALTGATSASSDIWPLFFPLARRFLWTCCTLGAHRSRELLSLEPSLFSDIFLWGRAGSWGARSCFPLLRNGFRHFVSSVWNCFWLIGPWSGTDDLFAEDGCSCCCDKLERGSKGTKYFKTKQKLDGIHFLSS